MVSTIGVSRGVVSGFHAFDWRGLALLGILIATNGRANSPITVSTDDHGVKHFAIDGKTFVPIGVNLLRENEGRPYQTFDMFNTRNFRLLSIDHELKEISALGFNFVRLWLKGMDADEGFSLGPFKIGDVYVDNIVATLQCARRYNLYVVLTGAFRDGVWLPKNYLPMKPLPADKIVGGMNRLIMLPEMAESVGLFLHDLLVKLLEKDRHILATIFYIDSYNELHFDLAKPPFAKKKSNYIYQGRIYDLAVSANRQALMDKAAESWMRAVAHQIKAVNRELLVTASTELNIAFGHAGFDGGVTSNPRAPSLPYPLRPAAYLRGGADLIDMHIYPSPSRNGSPAFDKRVDQAMHGNDVTNNTALAVPLIVGELGAYKSVYSLPDDAVPELEATKQALCRFHFSGFAVWMWDGHGDTWTLADESLRRALAPRYTETFCNRNRVP